jgi:hypothetical protein
MAVPNSATDSSTPNHLNPVAAADAEDEVFVVGDDVVVVVTGLLVVDALVIVEDTLPVPGIH